MRKTLEPPHTHPPGPTPVRKSHRDEQFQTESSVHEHWSRARSKYQTSAEGRVLEMAERKIQKQITDIQKTIQSQRKAVDRLTIKCEAVWATHNQNVVLWRNAVEEVQATVSYFLWKLTDSYDKKILDLELHSTLQLAILSQSLEKQLEKRDNILTQLKALNGVLVGHKKQIKAVVVNHLLNEQRIKGLQGQIHTLCQEVKEGVALIRKDREGRERAALLELENVRMLLLRSISEEKKQRQINKQHILETFESLFHKKCLNML